MNKINLKYGLDERPPLGELILFGMQWLAISIPTIIIIGKVVAGFHFTNSADQVIYVQKLFFITALTMLVQLLWGHRLPLILGPAAVLLIGVIAGQGSNLSSIYSAIFLGGILLFILSITGLFSYLKRFFTPRVVAVILLLIAFTLAPTIMNLIIPVNIQVSPLVNICFALVFVILMFIGNRFLTGLWKSTLIIWAIVAGTLVYISLFPQYYSAGYDSSFSFLASFFSGIDLDLTINPGILFSFLVCFLALSINDIGSIQSVGELIKPNNMQQRITRGISITGLANAFSGLLGVIGPVNFSFSPGIIVSTGNASRFTLLPTAIGLLILSFMPAAIAFIGSIPSVVIGTVLIYVMCSQIAAGLLMAFNSVGDFNFDSGLIIGLPIMLGVIISFLPAEVLNTFPVSLRPILGNGFVIGVLAVIVLEHVIYKKSTKIFD